MNDRYEALRRQADQLQHRMRDFAGGRTDEAGRELIRTAIDVREDLLSDRMPRSVESRVLQMKRLLQSGTKAISTGRVNALLSDYEDLRRRLRTLPNY